MGGSWREKCKEFHTCLTFRRRRPERGAATGVPYVVR